MSRSCLSVLFSLVACGGAVASPIADQVAFSHPQQMVDIGGRRLHLYCNGTGSPTVVFDAPSADAGWSWHAVQPAIARRTRACVYDRAGLGYSDPSPLPGTSGNAVADLHKLLQTAGIAPPYVLVGTSYGGGNVQLYTYRYPEQVRGLVLVEPEHEDEMARLDRASQGRWSQLTAAQAAIWPQCVAAAEKGFVPGSEAFLQCTGGIQPVYGRELAAARLAVETSPGYWHAAASEQAHFDVSRAELGAARRSYGDLPLVVLTRGVSPFAVPGKPQSELNKATERENMAMHKEVAALSSRGSQRVVPGAGHIIQQDRPEAVVRAITDVLDELRP
ncbi:alpha/beta fold hydrolase [Pseudoduganella plicata]|nr:alpha/beta hydrolase [Pseudoduganella plicata]